jgi:formylmethanofuran dehydrogenase subunit E
VSEEKEDFTSKRKGKCGICKALHDAGVLFKHQQCEHCNLADKILERVRKLQEPEAKTVVRVKRDLPEPEKAQNGRCSFCGERAELVGGDWDEKPTVCKRCCSSKRYWQVELRKNRRLKERVAKPLKIKTRRTKLRGSR